MECQRKFKYKLQDFGSFYNVPRWNCIAPASALALKKLIEQIGHCNLLVHSQGADIAMQCLDLVPGLINHVVLIAPAAVPKLSRNFQADATRI